jgi:tRNA modification GTPase
MPTLLDPNDTIAALASAPGPAPRGIVRLSGPRAIEIARAGFLPDRDEPLPGRRASIQAGSLRVDGLRPLLPAMLAVWREPRSYTGQDVTEIHLPGTSVLVNLVLAGCLARGARHAEPGEFTLRAFLTGRIDLTRAEAVLAVIEARNPAQLEAALEQLAGGLSGRVESLRDRLLDMLAQLEANLDFAEEPDVVPLSRAALASELEQSAGVLAELARALRDRDRQEFYPRVVLVGRANAGKSRLFNALLGDDRAIVSPQAGTTRDYLSCTCVCDGLTVELVDTAGRDRADDAISRQAQSFRADQAERADLLLHCCPADRDDQGDFDASLPADRRTLRVWTKADLALPASGRDVAGGFIVTSAADGTGLGPLRSAIARALREPAEEGNLPAGTAARCRGSIVRAVAALESGASTLRGGGGDELAAFDLRVAIDELGKVVGAVVNEEILDRIFSRFCIGK